MRFYNSHTGHQDFHPTQVTEEGVDPYYVPPKEGSKGGGSILKLKRAVKSSTASQTVKKKSSTSPSPSSSTLKSSSARFRGGKHKKASSDIASYEISTLLATSSAALVASEDLLPAETEESTGARIRPSPASSSLTAPSIPKTVRDVSCESLANLSDMPQITDKGKTRIYKLGKKSLLNAVQCSFLDRMTILCA